MLAFLFVITILYRFESSLTCIATPKSSIVMTIQNRTLTVGSRLRIDVEIQNPTPDFKTVLRLSGKVADESSFNDILEPRNKSITYILKDAGTFTVQFEVLWFGKPFNLTDQISVYKPVLETNFDLNLDDVILFPPGNASLSLRIFDPMELPTNLSGKLNWGDGSPMQNLDLVNKTLPGVYADMFVPLFHLYTVTQNYTVNVELYNEVSTARNARDAGIYNVQMWVTGVAGISNIVKKLITIQKPVTTDHVILQIQEVIVTPPGLAALDVSVTDETELPTDIFGSIIWEENLMVDFDWKGNTAAGEKGTVPLTFNHNYLSPANYTVAVQIFNKVSRMTKTINTTVISELTVDKIYVSSSPSFEERENSNDVFASDKEIYFKIDLKSGESDAFYLEINGNNESSTTLPMTFTFLWAGNYTVRMWVSGQAGISNIVTKTIAIQKPITREHIKFQIPDIIVTPPGLTGLYVGISDDDELPTGISGSIIWEDDAIMDFDWEEYTVAGEKGTVSLTFNHTYLSPSSYTISIYISNEVSQITETINANVLPELIVEKIYVSNSPTFEEGGNVRDVFASDKEIYFETDLNSGDSDFFHMEINGNNESSETQPLNHTISWAGIYHVRMWATGQAGISNFVEKTITIQKQITVDHVNLQIQDTIVSPPGAATLTVSVSDETELPTDISGSITWEESAFVEFDWEDYTIAGKTGTVSRMYNHTYLLPRNYTISVRIFNQVSLIKKTINANVIPELTVEKIYLSNSTTFEGRQNSDYIFASNKNIFFRTDIKSGESGIFHLEINGKNETSETMPIAYAIPWAGKYTIRMWVTGEAGISNIVIKTIIVERPITPDHVNLQIQNPIVTPPGLAVLKVNITDEEELPTDVSGYITWDENAIEHFDWKEYTAAGQKGTVLLTFNHTYLLSANYMISMHMFNQVSQKTKTISANVISKLTVDEIYMSNSPSFDEGESNNDVFASNREIYFKTNLNSGDSDIFHLEINGNNESSEILPMNYSISWAGKYPVRMWVTGEAGMSNIASKNITIERPITSDHVNLQIPSIIVTPSGLAVLKMNITDEEELPTDIFGSITWDENVIEDFDWKEYTTAGEKGTVSLTFNYTYLLPANYTISVKISNQASQITKTTNANVIAELIVDKMYVSNSQSFDEGESSNDVFASNRNIYFKTNLQNGDSDTFFLEINEKNESSKILPMNYTISWAGIYEVRMWVIGQAGMSNVVNQTITIQRPIAANHVSLQIQDIIVMPPGEAVLNISLDAPSELPTEVYGSIFWEENEVEVFDWSELSRPGSNGTILKSFIHVYSMPNNYTVNVTMTNNVSSVLKSTRAFVIPDLVIEGLFVQDLSSDDDNETNAFPSRKTLNIRTAVISGVPEAFYLQIDDDILNSEEQPISYEFRKTGIYALTFWVTGMAGTSNSVSRRITIQREIFSKNIEVLNFPSQPVAYLGNVSFIIQISDKFEALSNMNIAVDWGDGSTIQSWVIKPGLDSSTDSNRVRKNLEYVYKTHGNYTVHLLVENEVSTFQKEYSITVMQKITIGGVNVQYENSSVAPSSVLCEKAFALLNDNIVFSPENLTGRAISWVFAVGNETLMENTVGEFRYNFTLAGWYTITLTAYGLNGDVESVSRSIFMGEEVTKLVAGAYPNVTRLNFQTVIAIRSSWVFGACLTIDYGDGSGIRELCDPIECTRRSTNDIAEERPPNPDVFAKHVYSSVGRYKVTVRLIGPLNAVTETLDVIVADFVLCTEMEIFIDNPSTRENPMKVRRQDSVRLESRSSLNDCKRKIKSTIEWNIEEIDETFQDFIPEETAAGNYSSDSFQMFRLKSNANFSLEGLETHNPIFLIPPKNLSYGLYYVSVTYIFYAVDEANYFNEPREAKLVEITVVEIVKSELLSKMIKGSASVILRGDQQLLTLCASCYSYDPDGVYKITKYTWWCKREGEEWSSSVVSNLPSSREEYARRKDLGGCWGKGSGLLNTIEGSLFFNASLFFVIPANYSIKLEVMSEDRRRSSNVMNLEIVRGNPPILSSTCNPVESCTFFDGVVSVNPIKLILATSCIQDSGLEGQDLASTFDLGDDGCGSPPVQYEWIMYGINFGSDPVRLNLTGYAAGLDRFNFALLETFWTSDMSIYSKYQVVVTGKRVGQDSRGKTMLVMQLNNPPVNGNCTILRNNTDTIKALVEKVAAECTGWEDPEDRGIGRYKFSVLYETGTKIPLWSGRQFPAILFLPFGNFTLMAEILDVQEAVTILIVEEISTEIPLLEEFDTYVESGIMSEAVRKQELSTVNMLLQAEKSVKLNLPNSAFGDDTKKNAEFLRSLDAFPTTNIDEILQATSILSTVAYPLPEKDQDAAIESLKSLAKKSESKASSPNLQKEFASSSIGTVSSLLKGVNDEKPKGNKTQVVKRRLSARKAAAKRKKDAEKSGKVDSMMGAVESSQQGILQSSVVGEEAAMVRSEGGVTMAVGFFDASQLKGKRIDVDGATYVFPHYCDLFQQDSSCILNKSISIGIKMAKWGGQVYGFGGGQDLLSEESSTVQLSLVDKWMNPIPVTNSFEDIIIYIPREGSVIPEADYIAPDMQPQQKFMAHAIDVAEPRLGVNIFLRPDIVDTMDEWILTWSLASPYNTTNFTVYYLKDLQFYEDIGFYGLFISSEEVGDEVGNRYIGIAKRNTSIDAILLEETQTEDDFMFISDNITYINNSNVQLLSELEETFTSNYSLLTFVSSCLFFDKTKVTWSSEGCKVIGANLTATVCSCNHLTSFGSGLIVAPNAIDFSYVFANAGFTENLTIYLTLIFMICLYIIGMIYARIMDIRDKKKVGASPLPDNHPDDKYLYDMFVHTGLYPNSGTKSNVYFLITGDWDDTGARELRDPERKVLCRGSNNHFIMATERPLGPLQYLRIWHDNSGKGSKASWFFSYMVIRDVQTGEEFQFISNMWLAVEEGDGQIDRVIPVAGEAQLRDFSHVFGKTVEKNLNDDHLWLSVFMRPPRSRFTRVQRLSACMALLFLSMLVNAMFYERVPDEPGKGGLNVGPFSLSPEAMGVGLMSNLIVFPPSFLIILFFRKSRLRKTKPSRIQDAIKKQRSKPDKDKKSREEKGESVERQNSNKSLTLSKVSSTALSKTAKVMEVKKKKKFRLPWWFRIVAWILVAASIGSSVFFLWAYGIMFGDQKVQKWLTSLVVSIVSSMFITQPIKIYLMAVILSMIFKKPLNESEDYDDDEELMELEYDEEYVHEDSSSVRKKKVYLGSALSPEELREAKMKREKEVAMNSLIREILLYLMFLTVVLAISYGSRDPWIIYMKFHFSDLFAKTNSDNCPSFLEMRTTKDIWCWSREIFVPALLDDELYNGMSIYEPEIYDQLETSLTDRVSFLMGKAVFRQIRVRPDNCVMHPWIKRHFISECNGFSNFYQELENDFGKGWNANTTKLDPSFTYRSPFSVQGIPFSGTLDTYGGGGYIVEIENGIEEALHQIDDLEANNWLDKYTRAFFAEISIYNAQVNLFGVIMCVVEFVPGGGIHKTFKFNGLNLLRYHAGAGLFMLISELAFVIFTIFFIRREHKLWKKEGKKYFESKWNLMEILVITLSLTTIVFYTIKSIYSLYLVDKLTSSKGKKYIRMQSLAVFDETLTFIIGFLLFVATIKLLKLLRFNRRVGFLSETLKTASSDILGFGILFIVTLISFVTVFYIEAVTASVEFSTFIRSAETSIFEITKKFKEITTVSPVMGPIFYFIFAFIMYWIVLQVLIAVICHAFSRIKKDLSAQPNDYEVVEYMMGRFMKFLSVFKIGKGKVSNQEPEKRSVEQNLQRIHNSLDRIIVLLHSSEDA